MLILSTSFLCAQSNVYLCEAGVQGGVNYYVGDAANHIFQNIQPVAGGQFRYKFTQRWALTVKGEWTRIKYEIPSAIEAERVQHKKQIDVDITAEYNFFRFGEKQYDDRIKPITPYIFLGVGFAMYGDYNHAVAYLPFGFGMKWKFSPRFTLLAAWQHNLYFTDYLEDRGTLNNTYDLNGHDFLNNDLTGELTVGIVFEFAKQKKNCRCDW